MDSATLSNYKVITIASSLTLLFTLGITIITTASTIDPVQAETGEGEDIFKVIMTLFGVDKSKGDVIAVVTVNNGEASRVKFLDAEAPYVMQEMSIRHV
jgi:hypothetical protein